MQSYYSFEIKTDCRKSQFDCHIEFIEIQTIKLIAFDKLRLTILLRQPLLLLTGTEFRYPMRLSLQF
jgi:hypothetical protein